MTKIVLKVVEQTIDQLSLHLGPQSLVEGMILNQSIKVI